MTGDASDFDSPVKGGFDSDDAKHRRNLRALSDFLRSPHVSSATIRDASITNANIEDATIDSAKIKSLAVDKLTAGTLTAGIILAAAMKTADTGVRVEIDAAGIRMIDASGNLVVNLKTDDGSASFAGYIEASGIQINGNMKVLGTDNRLEPGSAITLGGGASAANPSTAPTLSTFWSHVSPSNSQGRRGLFYDSAGTSFWTTDGSSSIYEYDASTGASIRTKFVNDASSVYGVARVGTRVYVLYRAISTGDYVLQSYTQAALTYLGKADVQVRAGITIHGEPGLGDDGSNLFVVDLDAATNGKVRFHKFSRADSPAFVSTTVSSGGSNPTFTAAETQLTGFAAAESKWWVSFVQLIGGDAIVRHNTEGWNTSAVYQSQNDFPGEDFTFGLTYDGTYFRTLNAAGQFCQHTNWVWTSESPVYWVKYTWVNDTAHASSGSRPLTAGDLESTGSPTASITHKKRAWLKATSPGAPTGLTDVGWYMDRGAAEPTLDYQTDTTAKTKDFVTFTVDASHAPPATGTFAGGATNSLFQSDDGSPLVRANGYPRARIESGTPTANQPIATGAANEESADNVNATITADTGDVALSGTGAANSKIQLNIAGQWLVIASARWDSGNTGYREMHLETSPDGSTWTDLSSKGGLDRRATAATNLFLSNTVSTIIDAVDVGDYIRIRLAHTEGVNLNLLEWYCSLLYLGPA